MNTVLTAIPNVSTPCVTTDPCTCPIYGPGGVYNPILTPDGPVCWLALEAGPAPLVAEPVPAFSPWAFVVLAVLLCLVAVRNVSS